MKTSRHRIHRLARGLGAGSLLVVLCGSRVLGVTLEDVKLDPKLLPPGCSQISGEHAVSIQAATHYATIQQAPPILFNPPTRKAYQSFKCGRKKSTIYFYEYASSADLEAARGFTEGTIWGGERPTADHPELIIARDNVLVIISSRDPDIFRKHLEKQP